MTLRQSLNRASSHRISEEKNHRRGTEEVNVAPRTHEVNYPYTWLQCLFPLRRLRISLWRLYRTVASVPKKAPDAAQIAAMIPAKEALTIIKSSTSRPRVVIQDGRGDEKGR